MNIDNTEISLRIQKYRYIEIVLFILKMFLKVADIVFGHN